MTVNRERGNDGRYERYCRSGKRQPSRQLGALDRCLYRRAGRTNKNIKLYTSDKKRNEGLDELWIPAKAMEKTRDDALARGPYFDYGKTFLQIAIVLASVAIVTGALVLSLMIGAAGLISAANGTFMFATLPGL